MMAAALICVISVAVFLQFFVSYCRSVLTVSRKVELSDRVREVSGIANRNIGADDFARLVQLVRLCPEQGDDATEIRAVGTYYGLLRMVKYLSTFLIPALGPWTERECESCSHFAAVALDRRISYSRDLFTQQVADRT
jgi:hypothetical protein